ncbi:unnamed protein product [Pleuronectes platessa]|uniref:Uncharacterized protein n=1 Tax=Pleuronectes platessa TaxID=8262 RepID=A0A9N7YW40_PLEPL|nr:unnamed protein product [Pleuronectes platessa]
MGLISDSLSQAVQWSSVHGAEEESNVRPPEEQATENWDSGHGPRSRSPDSLSGTGLPVKLCAPPTHRQGRTLLPTVNLLTSPIGTGSEQRAGGARGLPP